MDRWIYWNSLLGASPRVHHSRFQIGTSPTLAVGTRARPSSLRGWSTSTGELLNERRSLALVAKKYSLDANVLDSIPSRARFFLTAAILQPFASHRKYSACTYPETGYPTPVCAKLKEAFANTQLRVGATVRVGSHFDIAP